MSIDRHTLLFFDASCLIAAAGSPSGGSGFLLSLCARELLRAAVSQSVLLEAERNLLDKRGLDELNALHRLLILTPLLVVPIPMPRRNPRYRQIVGEKDEHVVAAAIAAQAPCLVTLDKPLTERITQARLPLTALAPGTFIKTLLPSHADYPELRQM